MTFANSWRLSEAYIIIGVEDLNDGRRNPCGINPEDHIDDATLQQFVNSKTNRQVRFSYEAFHYDGKSFGLIIIPKQKRPLYAKKDFGIVKCGEVYFRRGSSCAVATPDDLYQMGIDDEKEDRTSPIIQIELADLKRRVTLGTSIRLETVNHNQHNKKDFPDEVSSDNSLLGRISFDRVNRNYWREVADYTLTRRAFVPISFAATSASGEVAKNVRIEVNQSKEAGITLLQEDNLPEYPAYESGFFSPSLLRDSAINAPKNLPKVRDHHDRWTLLIDFGDIQPKATCWAAEPIYVAAIASGHYSLAVIIYADNLRQPQEAEIGLHFDIDMRLALTPEEIYEVDQKYTEELRKK